MSHIDDSSDYSLATGGRTKMPNQTLDADAVDRERLVSLFNSKRGFAANVSRQYNNFVENVRDGCSIHVAQDGIQHLEDAFKSFKDTHGRYCDLAAVRDPDRLRESELQYQEIASLFKRARCMSDGMLRGHLVQKVSSTGSRQELFEDNISVITSN